MKRFVTALLTGIFAMVSLTSIYGQDLQDLQDLDPVALCSKAKKKAFQLLRSQNGTPDHRARMNKYDIHFYHLRVKLDTLSTYIEGHVSIHAIATAQLDTFSFELDPVFTIDSLKINGQLITNITNNDVEWDAILPSPVSAGSQIVAHFYYKGTARRGLFNQASPTWGTKVTYSLTEPYDALGWFPCKQELPDKADSVQVEITVPLGTLAGSNGLLIRVDTVGNQHTFVWKSTYPIAYYLISVSVAKYIEYGFDIDLGNGITVPFINYIYSPTALAAFKEEIDTTAALMRIFSNLFGTYPFYEEKYGHCMAPFGGGMEHQTMTTQGFFFMTLTAHELMHQWFGNNVTCKRWNDIWLNEGFASYGEYVALENLAGSEAARSRMTFWHQSIMSRPDGSVYVPDQSIGDESRIFDSRLSYRKGAAVIHTLRYLLGDSVFFNVLREYHDSFRFSTVTTEEFRQFVESRTGADLTNFFDEWIYGEGYPIYDVKWNWQNDSLYISIIQSTAHPSVPLFTTPVPIRVFHGITYTDLKIPMNNFAVLKRFYFPDKVDSVKLDPLQWVINKDSVAYDSTLVFVSAEIVQKPLWVFPDPARNIIHVWTRFPGTLLISSIDGRTITIERIKPGHKAYSLTKLHNGIYVATIITEYGTFADKFVKH